MTGRLKGDNCECRACGLLFKSTAAFDKHRTGSYRVKGERRCLDVQEMEDKGMAVNARGFWITRRNPSPLG